MNDGERVGEKKRDTRETSIEASIRIDGEGNSELATGVGFLDHMITLLAKHSGIDVYVTARGDLEVDAHHTTEDVGIVLGDAFKEALGDKSGIARFADASVPMQESLVAAAVDICGRPHLTYEVGFPAEKIGNFDTDLIEEFLHAFVVHAGITLHVQALRGDNSHHIAEAVFKALARVLRDAAALDHRTGDGVPSTKGIL